ncbi:MAG TPA: aromatic ring-hydroxylating dioxygenase subunit alpha [Flavitalea sp.]|nr:aromatic ring-hydroxylating dioxygenase subunit alpha [Flavitalea sp.]
MKSNKLQKLLDNHHHGWSLEQPFYTNRDVFNAELETIWKKYWLFAGTIADIPKPGDYFLYKVHNDSIIIIRGNAGEVYAHYNTCRHRGSLICLEERGRSPKLICPYHQWVYDKDGSLVNARLMPDDFDKSAHGLHPVKVEVTGGLIFISLSDNPPPFKKVSDDYFPFLSPYKVENAKVAFRKTYTLRTNWKPVAENFRECYHCGPAHPEYCSAVIGANMKESAIEVLQERKVEWERNGLAINNVEFENDSFHFAIRYPLRPGVLSYSTDGAAVAIPMGEHKDYNAGVLGLVVLPNFWMDAVSDYMWTMRVTPLSPSNTEISLSWLVDKNAIEGEHYTLDHLTEFWKITGEQDWKLCENNFAGIESSHYQPGPYAPIETDVIKFVDWYLNRLHDGISVATTAS